MKELEKLLRCIGYTGRISELASVLQILLVHNDIDANRLALLLNTDYNSVYYLLRRLEEKGLVERIKSRRPNIIRLNKKKLQEEIIVCVKDLERVLQLAQKR